MWDFSGDEWIALLASSALALLGLRGFYASILFVRAPRGTFHIRVRLILGMTPPLALALLYEVLQQWADPVQVRGHADYILLFMAGGAAWIAAAIWSLPLMGVSPRHDAIERGNVAAGMTTVGAIVSFSLAYAGANIGSGPTVWTTFAPALLATATLLALGILLELLGGRIADAITLDRDVTSGIRMAMFLVCCGAILGRAVAGDWNGWEGLFNDLLYYGWPVIVLLTAAAVVDRWLGPSPQRPRPSVERHGLAPAMIVVVLTVAWLLHLGLPQMASEKVGGRGGAMTIGLHPASLRPSEVGLCPFAREHVSRARSLLGSGAGCCWTAANGIRRWGTSPRWLRFLC